MLPTTPFSSQSSQHTSKSRSILTESRYNSKWTRAVQEAISTVLLCAWLGGVGTESRPGEVGRLLTLEEVGEFFKGGYRSTLPPGTTEANAPTPVPINLKDRDAFHITIEDYLLALISNIDELSRLAMNSVTLGDTELAVRISSFIKDLHAGFQMLNLKNDILRKRVDSIKYAVKKVEDVVYDLSLRNLLPATRMEE